MKTAKRGLVRAAPAVVAAALSACTSDPRPATWDFISPIIMEPNCASASCHSRAAAAAGLDFSDADRGYESLTGLWVWIPNPNSADMKTLPCGTAPDGVPVCEEHFRPLVTPYVPSESRLIAVLRARGAPRMPPDRPLNEADIRLVEQWILDGAPRHGGPVANEAGASEVDGAADAGDGPAAGDALDGAADGLPTNADGGSDGGDASDVGSPGDVAPDMPGDGG